MIAEAGVDDFVKVGDLSSGEARTKIVTATRRGFGNSTTMDATIAPTPHGLFIGRQTLSDRVARRQGKGWNGSMKTTPWRSGIWLANPAD
jgi:hypothetical protein